MWEVEGSYEWIRDRAGGVLRSHLRALDPYNDVFIWVKDVFPDVFIAEFEDFSSGDTQLYSFPYAVEDGEITIEEGKRVKLDYVGKKREEARKVSSSIRKSISDIPLSGPVVRKNEIEGTVYAAVLVPGEEDLNGEPPLTKAEIRKYAHSYAPYQLMDSEHNFEAGAGQVVETFLVPDGLSMKNEEGDELPEGTWIVGAKPEPEHLAKFVSGEYGGFSLAGFNRSDIEELVGVAGKSVGDLTAKKNLLLKDLEDPVIGFVSYVKNPAVPKSKTFAIKGESVKESGGAEPESRGWFASFIESIGLSRKEEEDEGLCIAGLKVVNKYDVDQPRDGDGKWTDAVQGSGVSATEGSKSGAEAAGDNVRGKAVKTYKAMNDLLEKSTAANVIYKTGVSLAVSYAMLRLLGNISIPYGEDYSDPEYSPSEYKSRPQAEALFESMKDNYGEKEAKEAIDFFNDEMEKAKTSATKSSGEDSDDSGARALQAISKLSPDALMEFIAKKVIGKGYSKPENEEDQVSQWDSAVEILTGKIEESASNEKEEE